MEISRFKIVTVETFKKINFPLEIHLTQGCDRSVFKFTVITIIGQQIKLNLKINCLFFHAVFFIL